MVRGTFNLNLYSSFFITLSLPNTLMDSAKERQKKAANTFAGDISITGGRMYPTTKLPKMTKISMPAFHSQYLSGYKMMPINQKYGYNAEICPKS
jgi:hypothetical protein